MSLITKKEKFLIIGSNSFSGAHFVNGLLKRGYKVWGTSRSEQPKRKNSSLIFGMILMILLLRKIVKTFYLGHLI